MTLLDNEGAASRVGSLSPPTPPLSCQSHLPAGQKLSSGLLGLSQDQGALWNAKRLVVKLINYLRSVLLHDVPDGVCDAMTRGDLSLQPVDQIRFRVCQIADIEIVNLPCLYQVFVGGC